MFLVDVRPQANKVSAYRELSPAFQIVSGSTATNGPRYQPLSRRLSAFWGQVYTAFWLKSASRRTSWENSMGLKTIQAEYNKERQEMDSTIGAFVQEAKE